MVIIAQLLKMSAEHSVLENTFNSVEKFVERKGPKVMASRDEVDLDAVVEYRA